MESKAGFSTRGSIDLNVCWKGQTLWNRQDFFGIVDSRSRENVSWSWDLSTRASWRWTSFMAGQPGLIKGLLTIGFP